LDAFGDCTDFEIWEALKEVQMEQKVKEFSK
jgi:hypothetical protein